MYQTNDVVTGICAFMFFFSSVPALHAEETPKLPEATDYRGQGVVQDNKVAAHWYQKATEQGLADAEFNIG